MTSEIPRPDSLYEKLIFFAFSGAVKSLSEYDAHVGARAKNSPAYICRPMWKAEIRLCNGKGAVALDNAAVFL